MCANFTVAGYHEYYELMLCYVDPLCTRLHHTSSDSHELIWLRFSEFWHVSDPARILNATVNPYSPRCIMSLFCLRYDTEQAAMKHRVFRSMTMPVELGRLSAGSSVWVWESLLRGVRCCNAVYAATIACTLVPDFRFAIRFACQHFFHAIFLQTFFMGIGTERARYIPVALPRFVVQVECFGVSLARGDMTPYVQLSQQSARDCSAKWVVQIPRGMSYGKTKYFLIVPTF